MEFIMENGILIIAAVAVGIYVGMSVYAFVNRPRSEQINDAKEWLLYGVTVTEKALGSGTGQLKLRMAYDMFVTKFPVVARFVGFETFKGWVDEALDKVEDLLTPSKEESA